MTKEGRAKLAEKFAATTLGRSIAKGAVTGAAIEGAEELVQNPIEQLAAGDDPRTPESLKETAFGGTMGAIGGGALGGGIGIVGRQMRTDAQAVTSVIQAPDLDTAIQAAATATDPLHVSDVADSVTGGLVSEAMEPAADRVIARADAQTAPYESDLQDFGDGIVSQAMAGAVDRAERVSRESPAYAQAEVAKTAELNAIQKAARESGMGEIEAEDLQPVPSEAQTGGEAPRTAMAEAMRAAQGKAMLARMEALQAAKGSAGAPAVQPEPAGAQPAQEATSSGETGAPLAQPMQQTVAPAPLQREATAAPAVASAAPAQPATPAKPAPAYTGPKINGQVPSDMTVAQLQHAAKSAAFWDQKNAAAAELKRRDKIGETMLGRSVDQLTDKELDIAARKARKPGLRTAARAEADRRAAADLELAERLKAPGAQDQLRMLADEAGWAEKGGFMIRTGGERAGEEKVTRTSWVPKAEWWPARPVQENEAFYREAVAKAIAGESLTRKQKDVVRFLLSMSEDERAGVEVDSGATPEEVEEAHALVGNMPTGWDTMSEEEAQCQLDAKFGPSEKPVAESAPTGAEDGAAVVGPRGSAEEKPKREPGQDDEEVAEPVGRDGKRQQDRDAAKLDSNVSEFTEAVVNDDGSASDVLNGAQIWAKDAGLNEGQFRRALHAKWRDDDDPRMRELAKAMLGGVAEERPALDLAAPTEADLKAKYQPGQKYHGPIPEIRLLPISAIYRQEMDFRPEVTAVSDEVAKSMDFSQPVDATAFRFGPNNDDQQPIVTLTDGHHRIAAAIQTGRAYLPVNVKAINAKGEKLNALIEMSRAIESAQRPALDLSAPTAADLKSKQDSLDAAAKAKAEEDAAAEAKQKADAERGDFGLTGSDRAADANPGQSDIFARPARSLSAADLLRAAARKMDEAAAPKAADGSEDLASEPGQAQYVVDEVSQAEGRSDAGAREPPPTQGDLFAASSVPGTTLQGVETWRFEPRQRGTLRVGFDRLDTPQKAAHAFAALRKAPREHFQLIVTDGDDRPIAAMSLFSGAISQASVYPEVVTKAIYQTPGAKKVWMAHNHPSGVPEPSMADESLTRQLAKTIDKDLGVELMGHLIIAGRQAAMLNESGDPVSVGGDRAFSIPPAARKFEIPITERTATKIGKPGPSLQSPAAVGDFLRRFDPKESGLVLLDNQHRVTGWLPMSLAEMGKLRTGSAQSGGGKLFADLGRMNPGALIAYSPDAALSEFTSAVANVGAAVAALDIKMLDGFVKQDGSLISMMERGHDTAQPAFFSRAAAPTFEQTDDGPVLVGDRVSIVQPSAWRTEGEVQFYEHLIIEDGKAVGRITLGWRDGKIVQLPAIKINGDAQTAGLGESTLRTLLQHNGDAEIHIQYIAPAARGFWEKMGVQFFETETGEDGTLTSEGLAAARGGERGAEAGGSTFARDAAAEGPGVGRAAQGLTEAGLRSAVAEAFGTRAADRLIGNVIVPLADQSELPEHVVPFVRSGDTVYGFFDPKTGKTYAVLSNLTPDMVRGLVLHEVGVHHGFEGMLGAEKHAQVMRRLDLMAKAGNKDVQRARATAEKESARTQSDPGGNARLPGAEQSRDGHHPRDHRRGEGVPVPGVRDWWKQTYGR